MATAVGLNMKITADTAGIGRGINSTEKALAGLGKSAASAASSLRGLVAIEVGTRLASAFTSAVQSAVNYANSLRTVIDETAKVAQRTGIAVEALQGLQVAADLAGVGNLEGTLQRFSSAVAKAAEGTDGARAAFEKLGLNVDMLDAMAPEDQFRTIAKAISEIPDAAGRAAAATAIFGRSGVELLPLFASNLEEIEKRADRLGIVLSEDQTGAIESMNDALSLVSKTFDGIIGQVTANLAPIVTDLVEEFLSFVEAFDGASGGGSGIADVITEGLLDFAQYLAGVFDSAVEQFESFGATMETVSAVFDFVSNTFMAVAEALRGVFNIFEIAGNGIAFAIGKAVEFFGSYFSRSAAEFGKTMAENALKEMDKNSAQASKAFSNAGRSASAAIFGSDPGSQGPGSGRASTAVQNARDRFANRNSPEMQAERERKKAAAQAAREEAARARAREREDAARKKAEEDRLKLIEKVDEKIAKVEQDRAKRATEIEQGRLDALSKASNDALNVSDIRSGGISDVLRIAAGREDPAIAEYRKQLGELQKIDQKLAELQAEKVEIIGGGKGRAA